MVTRTDKRDKLLPVRETHMSVFYSAIHQFIIVLARTMIGQYTSPEVTLGHFSRIFVQSVTLCAFSYCAFYGHHIK